MKPFSLFFAALITMFVTLHTAALGQVILPKGIDNPVPRGSFIDTITITYPIQVPMKISCSVTVWSDGDNYTIDNDSIISERSIIDPNSISPVDLYAMIVRSSVAQGVALGYTPCPAGTTAIINVTFPASVYRTPYGFANCGSDQNKSSFIYSSVDGVSTITQSGFSGGDQPVECEATSSLAGMY